MTLKLNFPGKGRGLTLGSQDGCEGSLSSSEATLLLRISYCRVCQPQLGKKSKAWAGWDAWERHVGKTISQTGFVP